ncbi:MAG: hypothetical protein ACREOG_05905 [Gemmatimonadaceae bacterium]
MWSRISFPNEWEALSCAALLVIGCAGEKPPPPDTTTATAAAAQSGGAGSDTTCPKSGPWQPCSVLDRLEAAGLVVTQQAAPARFPFFSVDGTTYTTTRSTIHVFLYPNQAARRRDTDQLDSVAVAPRNGSHTWSEPAVLVNSNNLAAVVVSPNERQAERIILALGAGLPAAKP